MVFLFFLSQVWVLLFGVFAFTAIALDAPSQEKAAALIGIILMYGVWLILSWAIFFDNYNIKVLLETVK